jgi:hypothetical protein
VWATFVNGVDKFEEYDRSRSSKRLHELRVLRVHLTDGIRPPRRSSDWTVLPAAGQTVTP